MSFDDVKELITMLDNSKLAYFEMENKDGYIKIDKSMSRNYVSNNIDSNEVNSLNKNSEAVNIESVSSEVGKDLQTSSQNQDTSSSSKKEEGVEFIKSPIVGTFYSKSSPEAEAFVQKGDVVHKGDIVCIVEAMKLMNEITAEFDCEILDVTCADGNMVEYGQKLFKVKRV